MKYRNYLLVFVLILLSLIPLLDLFHPGLPLTHDGQDHVARIANFYQNLTEGILIPRWAPNLNWGYGHPILMFLYPISSYSASLFHFLGFSLIDSVKIVFSVMFILSGLSMYLFASAYFNKTSGLLAGILYMFTPYRFIDLYVRGAIGEHTAFVFLPLVLFFILKLSKKYSHLYVIGGAFSMAVLILSHNAISLMFMPVILFFAVSLIVVSKQKKLLILNIFYLLFLGFALASFFWMPAFFEGKYTLRNIVTAGEYSKNFIQLQPLFYGIWNYGGSGQFSIQLGIINLFALFFSPILFIKFFKKRNKHQLLLLFLISYSLLVIFLMIQESNFIWKKIIILQNFQFPWRFLSVLVFTTAALSCFVFMVIPRKLSIYFCIFLIAAVLYFNKDYWHAKGYLFKPESFYTNVYDGTTDTGESAPIWSIRFMEKRPSSKIEVIDGKAVIKELERDSTRHIYKIKAEGSVRIRENTLYFPGWIVLIDGKPVNIEFQDQKNRGLITFYVPIGVHNVSVLFQDTKLRKFSNYISLGSIIVIAGIFFYNFKRGKNNFIKND